MQVHILHHFQRTSTHLILLALVALQEGTATAMSFFTGQHTGRKKVALGGRSRAEESREQMLERTHLDRERRRQAKLEQKSATTIQVPRRASSVSVQYTPARNADVRRQACSVLATT